MAAVNQSLVPRSQELPVQRSLFPGPLILRDPQNAAAVQALSQREYEAQVVQRNALVARVEIFKNAVLALQQQNALLEAKCLGLESEVRELRLCFEARERAAVAFTETKYEKLLKKVIELVQLIDTVIVPAAPGRTLNYQEHMAVAIAQKHLVAQKLSKLKEQAHRLVAEEGAAQEVAIVNSEETELLNLFLLKNLQEPPFNCGAGDWRKGYYFLSVALNTQVFPKGTKQLITEEAPPWLQHLVAP